MTFNRTSVLYHDNLDKTIILRLFIYFILKLYNRIESLFICVLIYIFIITDKKNIGHLFVIVTGLVDNPECIYLSPYECTVSGWCM